MSFPKRKNQVYTLFTVLRFFLRDCFAILFLAFLRIPASAFLVCLGRDLLERSCVLNPLVISKGENSLLTVSSRFFVLWLVAP